MNLNDYQKACSKTASSETKLQGWTLGLCGETGEFADIVKKHTEHGVNVLKNGKIVRDAMIEELGDVLYYLAVIADFIDVDLDTVAGINIAKLAARYPDGFRLGGGVR